MKIRLTRSLQSDSIVDGDGIRTVIWTQGCSHNCKGCHNPQTHSFTEGFLVDVEDIKKEISNLELQDGITFSGGDPMFQVDACLEIAKYCQSNGLNIWMYTGFIFEQLIASNKQNINELLKYVDILIDGRFILEQKSLNLMFRGSKNQRIIDVKKSLKLKKVITIKEYNNVQYLKKEEFIYV